MLARNAITPVQESDVGVFVNKHKARMTIQQTEDELQSLSTAHWVVSTTCIRYVQVTTDELIVVHNQSDAVHMKPFLPATDYYY